MMAAADTTTREGEAPLDAARSLAELLALRAAAHPERCAIDAGEAGGATYGELHARARAVAALLRARGAAPGERVGMALPRGTDAVVAILGILLAGAAYVPLDATYPAAHLRFVTSDAGLRTILAAPGWAPDATPPGAAIIDPRGAYPVVGSARPAAGEAEAEPRGSDPAYVIYTSGSTGRPKGVVVAHDNVLALMRATAGLFDFGPDDRWSLFHSHSFDFSVWEMWGALGHGGRMVVVPPEASMEPARTLRLLADRGVTVLNQVPSIFGHLVAAYAAEPVALELRYVVFGGEGVRLASVGAFLDAYRGGPPPQMVNMYGITETTVHATFKRLDRAALADPTRSPIGVALPHLDLRVVGPDGGPVADEEVGELHIAGSGVAVGYQDREQLTRERFAVADLGGGPRRYYRTGDLVRREPGGGLEYVGRADAQVKVRGFRIELGEVEAALRLHPSIADAAVIAVDSRLGEPMLAAFVVLTPGEPAAGPPLQRVLRRHVGERLPAQYVPGRVTALASLPLTPSGKVDRAALRSAPTVADRSGPAPEGGGP